MRIAEMVDRRSRRAIASASAIGAIGEEVDSVRLCLVAELRRIAGAGHGHSARPARARSASSASGALERARACARLEQQVRLLARDIAKRIESTATAAGSDVAAGLRNALAAASLKYRAIVFLLRSMRAGHLEECTSGQRSGDVVSCLICCEDYRSFARGCQCKSDQNVCLDCMVQWAASGSKSLARGAGGGMRVRCPFCRCPIEEIACPDCSGGAEGCKWCAKAEMLNYSLALESRSV